MDTRHSKETCYLSMLRCDVARRLTWAAQSWRNNVAQGHFKLILPYLVHCTLVQLSCGCRRNSTLRRMSPSRHLMLFRKGGKNNKAFSCHHTHPQWQFAQLRNRQISYHQNSLNCIHSSSHFLQYQLCQVLQLPVFFGELKSMHSAHRKTHFFYHAAVVQVLYLNITRSYS